MQTLLTKFYIPNFHSRVWSVIVMMSADIPVN